MADKNPDSQEAKLRSVRRRLNFGEDSNDVNLPTKEELERKFEEERAKHLEEKKQKWNFDFKEGRPLEGRWKWERIDSETEEKEEEVEAPGSTNGNAAENAREAPTAEDQAQQV